MKAGFKTILLEAKQNSIAVGAFNIFNGLSAMAAVKAAEEENTSIILQTSVATVKQIGTKNLIQMLHNIQDHCEIPVAIHLDHCRDPQLARDCIDAGWDSVMFDGSHLPFEENIACTQAICEYAHQHHVDVEGELGAIAGVEDDIISEKREYTDYRNLLNRRRLMLLPLQSVQRTESINIHQSLISN